MVKADTPYSSVRIFDKKAAPLETSVLLLVIM